MAASKTLFYDMALKVMDGRFTTTVGGERVGTLRNWNNFIWMWNEGRFVQVNRGTLVLHVLRWMQSGGLDSDPRVAEKVTTNLEAILVDRVSKEEPPCWVGDGAPPGRWVGFRNGVVNVDAAMEGREEIRPHSPKWFTTNLLPYSYVHGAKSELFERCMEEWTEGDQDTQRLLQEFVGYCLVPDTRFQVALFLEGVGANGKGVFCEAIRKILGNENISAVGLSSFGTRFGLLGTVGKLVNLCTEVDPGSRLPIETLKAFIAGDTISTDVKYRVEPLMFRPTARLIISWNKRPRITDTSEGFWRRVKLVRFPRYFRPEERDPLLGMKLDAEAPGMFNWALAGLSRLLKRGSFEENMVSQATADLWRTDSDPIGAFLREHYRKGQGDIPKEDVMRTYEKWCLENDKRIHDMEVIGRRIHEMFPGVTSGRRRDGESRTQVFKGLVSSKE